MLEIIAICVATEAEILGKKAISFYCAVIEKTWLGSQTELAQILTPKPVREITWQSWVWISSLGRWE